MRKTDERMQAMGTQEMTRERGTIEKVVRSLLPYMVLGGVIGFAFGAWQGYTDGHLISWVMQIEHDWTVYIALLLTVAYIGGGLAALAATAYPKRLAKTLEVQPEDIAENPLFYQLQGASALLLGLAIGVLVLAKPIGFVPGHVPFAMFAVFMLCGIAAYLKSYRMMDELMRAMASEAITITYWLIVAVGGGWAVLGHLELTQGPGFLDIVNILWGMIIFPTLWSGTKRGVLYS